MPEGLKGQANWCLHFLGLIVLIPSMFWDLLFFVRVAVYPFFLPGFFFNIFWIIMCRVLLASFVLIPYYV